MLECEVGGYLVRARRTDAWEGDGGQARLPLLRRLMEFVLHTDETASRHPQS